MEFEALYRQHVAAVFRFAVSLTRKHEIAEDLTAEAFLALHRELDRIDPAQLPGWLLTVVRNRARDWWRHAMVEQRHAEHVKAQGPRMRATAPPLEHWILESNDLKPVHRACVMLRYVHGMSRDEIGRELGLTDNQVKGHLQYALTLLRKAYGVTVHDREARRLGA